MNQQPAKPSLIAQVTSDVAEGELENPNLITVGKVIWQSIRSFFTERTGQLIGSAFILLMLWGYHGNLDLLKIVLPAYQGPGVGIGTRPQILPGIPWDNELISFLGGFFLLVVIPIFIIKFVFKEPLSNFGLGLPPKNRRRLALWTFLALTLVTLPAFIFASQDASMRAVYPFYRPFPNIGSFILYEISYLPFFITIEFIFRGYLLFGLAGVADKRVRALNGDPSDAFAFHKYALLIQMLSYTAWHLGKPLPELWGTLLWGLAAGAMAYAIKSIWPVVASHWLLNVVLDFLIARPI
jgi:hypothetical protein